MANSDPDPRRADEARRGAEPAPELPPLAAAPPPAAAAGSPADALPPPILPAPLSTPPAGGPPLPQPLAAPGDLPPSLPLAATVPPAALPPELPPDLPPTVANGSSPPASSAPPAPLTPPHAEVPRATPVRRAAANQPSQPASSQPPRSATTARPEPNSERPSPRTTAQQPPAAAAGQPPPAAVPKRSPPAAAKPRPATAKPTQRAVAQPPAAAAAKQPRPAATATRKERAAAPAKRASSPQAAAPAVSTAGGPAPSATRAALVMRSTPPWMVSMLLHTGLLIALALLAVPVDTLDFVEIVARQGDEVGDRLLNDTVEIPVYDATAAAQEFAVDVNLVHNPLAARRELEIELEEFEPELQADGPTIGRALSGRQKGARRALLAAYGGTGETESAVQRGLEWLQRHQARDGSWSLEGPYPNGGVFENTPAATAMALLAFLGAGHTHQEGEFREVVARGAKALVKLQDNEGSVIRHVAVENHRLYTQAQATIALCELYGMTRDEAFRQPAQRALDYAARSQAEDDAGGGGWRYLPRQYIDTSVTGWFVMALQSGKMAGLQVSEPALLKVGVYLDSVTSDGTHYRYMPDYPPSVVMTAEALLCRQYLGWERDDPRLTAGARHLLEHPIDWSERNVYYWYYATQMLHHMGGDDWDRWNRRLRVEVPKGQEQAGRQRGSWSPLGDEHGSDAGRLYTTCFCLYMLEVYYRHLPIYRHEGL